MKTRQTGPGGMNMPDPPLPARAIIKTAQLTILGCSFDLLYDLPDLILEVFDSAFFSLHQPLRQRLNTLVASLLQTRWPPSDTVSLSFAFVSSSHPSPRPSISVFVVWFFNTSFVSPSRPSFTAETTPEPYSTWLITSYLTYLKQRSTEDVHPSKSPD